jgi:flagellar biosynthetic protein FlhB
MSSLVGGWIGEWRDFFSSVLTAAAHPQSTLDVGVLLGTGICTLKWWAPVAGLSWIVAVAAAVVQGGVVFAPAALSPQVQRFNPASNLRQLFNAANVSRLLKSLLPSAATVACALSILSRDWVLITHASRMTTGHFARTLGGAVFEIAWKSALVMVIWSGLDYLLQRRTFETNLRMSKQEVRDESKETEGNPVIRNRVRRLQRQMRRQRMMTDVPSATVVVTNPTHYAVALRYDMQMAAPVVVAKGRNRIAQQIKEVAQWHGIPLIENRPVAQALYRVAEVGSVIPAKLYVAVAEILAYVYKAQQQAKAQAARNESANHNGDTH